LGREESGLYSWKYQLGSANPVYDKNNATDGDILVAWALLKAAAKWESEEYFTRAKQIIAAIKSQCVRDYEGYKLLLPGYIGFDHSEDEEGAKYMVINPCYYIYAAFKEFYKATNDETWNTLITDGERLAADFLSYINPAEKILPDWFIIENGGTFNWDPNHTRQAGWDAIRCPMYSYWYNNNHAWVRLWKDWYATKGTLTSTPAGIDIVSSGIADQMYSAYPGFTAVYNLIKNNTATAKTSNVSYYLDSLEILCWLAYRHW
jgi:endoglucanase